MAVRLETGVKRFIGLSTDQKPQVGPQADGTLLGSNLASTDLPPGSTFLESDSGKLFRWSGEAWTYPSATTYANSESELLLEAINALRVEVAALRMGMIDAGNCKEVNLIDVA